MADEHSAGSGEMMLRHMTPEDLAQVGGIEKVSFKNPWPVSFFQQCLEGDFHCWVYDRKGIIEAYAVTQLIGKWGHLLNICVRERSRRSGLGRRLIGDLAGLLRGEVAYVFLEVRASNEPAIGLYKSMGFRQAGVRKDYYSDPSGHEDALVFVCRL